MKDFELESIQTEGGYHRRGFSVLYRYPGEGVANLSGIWSALAAGLGGRELPLAVEGLDSRADVGDQLERLAIEPRARTRAGWGLTARPSSPR